jgi:hypothetical protein
MNLSASGNEREGMYSYRKPYSGMKGGEKAVSRTPGTTIGRVGAELAPQGYEFLDSEVEINHENSRGEIHSAVESVQFRT